MGMETNHFQGFLCLELFCPCASLLPGIQSQQQCREDALAGFKVVGGWLGIPGCRELPGPSLLPALDPKLRLLLLQLCDAVWVSHPFCLVWGLVLFPLCLL